MAISSVLIFSFLVQASSFSIGKSKIASYQKVLKCDSKDPGRYRDVAFKTKKNNVLFQSLTGERDAEQLSTDDQQASTVSEGNINESSSKRSMLTFAIPALGIYLANPLLSNIDNAFVGRTVGTAGLAALSPATICSDQMLYFFSFLSRATTGIVSRAYTTPLLETSNINGSTPISSSNSNARGNAPAARDAGSAPLTVSLICGFLITIFYVFFTPNMLVALNVNPSLRPDAAAYIYWRGAIAWAALAQSVCLSMLMSVRDPITPLKIVGFTAAVNIVGDTLLCVWPFRWGCAGAAAATSFATLVGCGFMLKALDKRKILPRMRLPSKTEFMGLMEYTGPLLAITTTRLAGFIAMQKVAMKLGTQALAGYQLCINLLLFFLLFGEPLSQLSQTKLPGLLDQGDSESIRGNLKSVSVLASITSISIAALSYVVARFGAGLVSKDAAVISIAQAASPSLFVAVVASILAVAVDGALMASRDFTYMLIMGLSTFIGQLILLQRCTSVSDILIVFALRLGTYAVAAVSRIMLGFGGIGRTLNAGKLAVAR